MKEFRKLTVNQQLFLFYSKQKIYNDVITHLKTDTPIVINRIKSDYINYVVRESLNKAGLRVIDSHIKRYGKLLYDVIGEDIIDVNKKQYIEILKN